MTRSILRPTGALLVLLAIAEAAACKPEPASDITIETLPEVTPSIPQVPTIPPPPFPVTWPDGSYSIYGARRRAGTTINTELTITGYIVDIYQSPCDPDPREGDQCRALAPHMRIADSKTEQDQGKWMRVVGYAENENALCEVIADARRGRTQEVVDGQIAIPTDFAVGAKVKVTGRFARIASAGFNESTGLLEYRAHETTEQAEEGAVTSCNRANQRR